MIIINKHGIYELPHKLPDYLRLRILGNIKKISKFMHTAQSFFQAENFVNDNTKLVENGN